MTSRMRKCCFANNATDANRIADKCFCVKVSYLVTIVVQVVSFCQRKKLKGKAVSTSQLLFGRVNQFNLLNIHLLDNLEYTLICCFQFEMNGRQSISLPCLCVMHLLKFL